VAHGLVISAHNTYEELVEGCGASSGLDVTMGKQGATRMSPGGWVVVHNREMYIMPLVSQRKNHLNSFLYLCSRLLVYFKACLWTKVSLSPWSITSRDELNSLTISQILMDLSLTGYPQGPAQADQLDWMIAVSSVSMCTGSPSAFLPFARREQHKTTSTGF